MVLSQLHNSSVRRNRHGSTAGKHASSSSIASHYMPTLYSYLEFSASHCIWALAFSRSAYFQDGCHFVPEKERAAYFSKQWVDVDDVAVKLQVSRMPKQCIRWLRVV